MRNPRRRVNTHHTRFAVYSLQFAASGAGAREKVRVHEKAGPSPRPRAPAWRTRLRAAAQDDDNLEVLQPAVQGRRGRVRVGSRRDIFEVQVLLCVSVRAAGQVLRFAQDDRVLKASPHQEPTRRQRITASQDDSAMEVSAAQGNGGGEDAAFFVGRCERTKGVLAVITAVQGHNSCRTRQSRALSMVPTGPGRFIARNPRIPSRLAGLHPGLLSRRASGTCAFCTIPPCASPSTWLGAHAGWRMRPGRCLGWRRR